MTNPQIAPVVTKARITPTREKKAYAYYRPPQLLFFTAYEVSAIDINSNDGKCAYAGKGGG